MLISTGGWPSSLICLSREIHALPREQFYFLGSSEFPSEHPIFEDLNPGTSGIVTPWLDLRAEDVLRAQGRWNGRGRTLLVRDAYPGAKRDDSVCMQLPSIAVGLHELAHLWDLHDKPLKPIPSKEVAEVMNLMLEEIDRDESLTDGLMWMTHRVQWVRLVIHLHHRSSLLGMPFTLHDILGYQHMGWPEEKDLREAIGSELDWTDLPFHLLRQLEVPYQLQWLYHDWWKSVTGKHSTPSESSRKESA